MTTYQKCSHCGQEKELNGINFGIRKWGYLKTCKPCANELSNRRRKKRDLKLARSSGLENSFRGGYRPKDVYGCLNLSIGNKYRITLMNEREFLTFRNSATFIGELIFLNEDMFVLASESGIRESFLKVDYLLGTYNLERIREVAR